MSLLLALALITGDVPVTPPTDANSSSTVASPAVPSDQKKAEKKICKVDDTNTGTRLAKRICLTRSQWEQRERGSDGRD